VPNEGPLGLRPPATSPGDLIAISLRADVRLSSDWGEWALPPCWRSVHTWDLGWRGFGKGSGSQNAGGVLIVLSVHEKHGAIHKTRRLQVGR
jgi:hypothetical protein